MRISDWSSDVCSSDLTQAHAGHLARAQTRALTPTPETAAIASKCRSGAGNRSKMGLNLVRTTQIGPFFSLTALVKTVALKRKSQNRSEEHTSELQSLMRISYAVFCLKKKNKNAKQIKTT